MTLNDWLTTPESVDLRYTLIALPDRKLHLLTAAFLRRVWDDLPSDQTRIAVEATEKFADGRIAAEELSRLRSADLLDSCEPLWSDPGYLDEDLIGLGCPCCEWVRGTAEYECRLSRNGYVLDGVSAAVERPSQTVIRALKRAREIVAWKADPDTRDAEVRAESLAQYEVFREIAGPDYEHPAWPQWRTSDVRAMARAIHRDQAFELLPILSDELQEAGCDDNAVLSHCRAGGNHARGCWVVDLALGFA
jgi:hypothetical protein